MKLNLKSQDQIIFSSYFIKTLPIHDITNISQSNESTKNTIKSLKKIECVHFKELFLHLHLASWGVQIKPEI